MARLMRVPNQSDLPSEAGDRCRLVHSGFMTFRILDVPLHRRETSFYQNVCVLVRYAIFNGESRCAIIISKDKSST